MRTDEGSLAETRRRIAPSETSAVDDEPYQGLLDATVLMVDDESTTTEILQAFLENAGYQNFISTSRSTRAVELMENERPDVVLLDLNMPEVSGLEILTEMRAHAGLKHIPVIVLTASTDARDKLDALRLGAADFLAKPVDPSELVLRLRNTLAAKAYQDRLANYDALTELPNRQMFKGQLDWALRYTQRNDSIGAVLHIDLDRFKQINETLGHSVGDTLLKEVSDRLAQRVRASDTVGRPGGSNYRASLSRVGGDEFTLLLPEVVHAENAAHVARRILENLAGSFSVEGHELFVTASIGIAVFPNDGDDRDTLLKHAEIAMSQAKQQGKNSYKFYSKEMDARSFERLSLENRLRTALDRQELLLYYQPKVSTKTKEVVGMEALLRWRHSELGILPPGQFIPLAEDTGLIVPIGEWVLRTACARNKEWQSMGLPPLNVAVNVSSQQFRQPGFLSMIQETIKNTGLDPEYLTIELTENELMKNAKENIEVLHQIKAMGARLSVDDFGTGYSSLSYLKRFPLDELKIDRAFVSQVDSDPDNAAIAAAIIAMAHRLGLTVVAEGVETEQELAFLSGQDCEAYQGYLFSKPLPEEEFAALLSLER